MKKPEIKVNFLYYETPFNIKKNFLINLIKKKYKVIISNKPDYVFFSVYKENNKFLLENGTIRLHNEIENKKESFLKRIVRKIRERDFIKEIIWFLREKNILKPYARIMDVKGDFVKIFYTEESIKPDMSKCDWAFGTCPESELNNKRYMRVPPYISIGDNMCIGDNFNLMKRKQYSTKIKKEKTKFCNFICNNHVPVRNNFFKKLSKYKQIDSPGKCMNNMPLIGSYKSFDESRSSINSEKEKFEFIKTYKFTIAFENSIRNGFNGRLIHPLLANSIPIFWGDKTVNRDFNSKCFINCNDFKNFNEVIKRVIEIDKDDKLYEEMLSQPWYNNKNQFRNTKKRIYKRFKEIFGK